VLWSDELYIVNRSTVDFETRQACAVDADMNARALAAVSKLARRGVGP
jgi:hypothetical protein